MPNPEWGVKRVCPTTGKRFYDLGRTPIVSPYTGEVVTIDNNPRARVAIAEKARAKVEEDDLVLEDDLLEEDENDVELDDDLLEDDEDDNVSLDDIADVGGGDDE